MLDIFNEIKEEIACVEKELRNIVRESDPLIKDTSVHLISAGGKRLRPAFCFLGGKFYNYDYKKILPLAVALELIHMASLVHDDVVDSSVTRRNIPTVKAMWGNKISMHLGDYLFGKSLKLIAGYDNLIIPRVLADTSVKMSEGEIQQLSTSKRADQTVRDYFYRIKSKTALLIAASCQLGAVACGAPQSVHLPLRRYGHSIGMAFQITDDILDLVADEAQLGKPIGSDLKQGIVTLPLIYALGHSERRDRLAEILSGEEKSHEEINEACEMIVSCGGVDYSNKIVQRYIGNARKQLKRLPDIPAREILYMVAEFISIRKF
ncbi:MAG: heptaprenyl diphosphate synthase [Peptococcaceae bacterium BRH_c4a]|nr:MAG: heptaprenyl diphosphate synthase [Peptococcaceae bacterium BRH_c4a]